MPRVPLIAGNWKMNETTKEAVELSQSISFQFERNFDEVDVAVCPPFTALKSVRNVFDFDRSPVKLGAQDVFWEEEGAYTGAISPHMLEELPCEYCIVGHSERREYFHETDEDVNRKVKALLSHEISPIMCCGEDLEVRDGGDACAFVVEQVRKGLSGLDAAELTRCVVAYEPIWAIGTGRAATPEQAEEVCSAIRATLAEIGSAAAAEEIRILYGGSMKPTNAEEFLSMPDIDGGLIGGASLDADAFARIVKAAEGCRQ